MENVKEVLKKVVNNGVDIAIGKQTTSMDVLADLITGTLKVDVNTSTITLGDANCYTKENLEVLKILGLQKVDIDIALTMRDPEVYTTEDVQTYNIASAKWTRKQAIAFICGLLDGTINVDIETQAILVCYGDTTANMQYGTVQDVLDGNMDVLKDMLTDSYTYYKKEERDVLSVAETLVANMLQAQ